MRPPGDTLRFTITVANTGSARVGIVDIRDSVFGNLDNQGSCERGEIIAAGQSYSCTFTGLVQGDEGDQHVSTTSVQVMAEDGTQISAAGIATVLLSAVSTAAPTATPPPPTPTPTPTESAADVGPGPTFTPSATTATVGDPPQVCLYLSDGVTGVAGAEVSYMSRGWHPFGTTGADGCTSLAIALQRYRFRVSYGGAHNDQVQNLRDNPTVVFQTVPVTVRLVDSTGGPLDTGNVSYFAGGWHTVGDTFNGEAVVELLPRSYRFRMLFAGAAGDIKQDVGENPIVTFQTVNVTVQLRDYTGAPLDTGSVNYFVGGWHTVGETTSGDVSIELLPRSYRFRMIYGSASADIKQDVGQDATVTFQTGTVSSASGTATEYHARGWQLLASDTHLLPGDYRFRFSDGTPNTVYTVTAGQETIVH